MRGLGNEGLYLRRKDSHPAEADRPRVGIPLLYSFDTSDPQCLVRGPPPLKKIEIYVGASSLFVDGLQPASVLSWKGCHWTDESLLPEKDTVRIYPSKREIIETVCPCFTNIKHHKSLHQRGSTTPPTKVLRFPGQAWGETKNIYAHTQLTLVLIWI